MTPSVNGRPFFCSWSGGKDSCLALYHALQQGGVPKPLFAMMAEGGQLSRSHGLPRSLLDEQSRQLRIPITFRSASWDEYEATFLEALHEFKADGVETGVFGDIDVDSNREWVERVCRQSGIAPFHPLWKRPRRALLEEFIDLGFKATIVAVNSAKLDTRFLGRTIERETVGDMEQAGIDPSGELGEYHTVVTPGPMFSSEIVLKIKGQKTHDGYSFLEMSG
ncbi:MAG: diphthine--ammonia ligase [Chloroflexi bacterium]|nr:diphthine--ammonia ligase [Chloroflexota bacterium]